MLPKDRKQLERLASWRPERGVISVHLDIDPADRSEGWRIELRHRLRAIVERAHEGEDRDLWQALEASAARVDERFDEPHPLARAMAGFVAVSEQAAEESWTAAQLSLPGTLVEHRPGPLLGPLVELLDRGAPRGVVAVSSERVRAWRWEMGTMEPRAEWEAVVTMPQWRERKGPSISDPAHGEMTTSSGHDQFRQRLEANRERFLHDAGHQLAGELGREGLGELLLFGDAPYVGELASGLPDSVEVRTVEDSNLIGAGDEEISSRVGEALERLRAIRDAELLEHALAAALASNGHGSLGVPDTAEALAEGRVDRLLFVPGAELPREPLSEIAGAALDRAGEDGDMLELLVGLALRTSADLIPLSGPAAEELRERGGVAALLRY